MPKTCGLVENVTKNILIDLQKFNSPSLHNYLSGFESFAGFVGGKSLCASPREAGDEIPGETIAKDISTNTNYCSRVKHGVYPALTVIAHN